MADLPFIEHLEKFDFKSGVELIINANQHRTPDLNDPMHSGYQAMQVWCVLKVQKSESNILHAEWYNIWKHKITVDVQGHAPLENIPLGRTQNLVAPLDFKMNMFVSGHTLPPPVLIDVPSLGNANVESRLHNMIIVQC